MALFSELTSWMIAKMPNHSFSRSMRGRRITQIPDQCSKSVIELLLDGEVHHLSQSEWEDKHIFLFSGVPSMRRARLTNTAFAFDEMDVEAVEQQVASRSRKSVVVMLDEVTVPPIKGVEGVLVKTSALTKASRYTDVAILDAFKIAQVLLLNDDKDVQTIFPISPVKLPLVKVGVDFFVRKFKGFNIIQWHKMPYSDMMFSAGSMYDMLTEESETLLQSCLSLMQRVCQDFPPAFNSSAGDVIETLWVSGPDAFSTETERDEAEFSDGFDAEETQEAIRRSLMTDISMRPVFEYDSISQTAAVDSDSTDDEDIDAVEDDDIHQAVAGEGSSYIVKNPIGRIIGDKECYGTLVSFQGQILLVAPKHQQGFSQQVELDGKLFDIVAVESNMGSDYVKYDVWGIDRKRSTCYHIQPAREGFRAGLIAAGQRINIKNLCYRKPFIFEGMKQGLSGSPLTQSGFFVGMAVMMSRRKEVICTFWNGSAFVHQCKAYLPGRELEFIETASWKDTVKNSSGNYRMEHIITANFLSSFKSSGVGPVFNMVMEGIPKVITWVRDNSPSDLLDEILASCDESPDVTGFNASWKPRFVAIRKATGWPAPETAIATEMQINPTDKLASGFPLITVMIKMVEVIQAQAKSSGSDPSRTKNGPELTSALKEAFSTYKDVRVWPLAVMELTKKSAKGSGEERSVLSDAIGATRSRDVALYNELKAYKFEGDVKTAMDAAFEELKGREAAAAGGHIAQEAALDRIATLVVYIILFLYEKEKKDMKKVTKTKVEQLLKMILGSLICQGKMMRRSVATQCLLSFTLGAEFAEFWKKPLAFKAGEELGEESKYEVAVCVLTMRRLIEACSLVHDKVLSRMSILKLGTPRDRLIYMGNLFNAEHVAFETQGTPMPLRAYQSTFLLVKTMYGESPHAYMGLKTRSVLSVKITAAGGKVFHGPRWDEKASDLDTETGVTREKKEQEEEGGEAD